MRRTDSFRKDPDAEKYWRQEEKGTMEDEMVEWHHQLDGHEFEWTLGVGDGQGGLACCSSWGRKELDLTEWLNWTEEKRKWCYCFFFKLCTFYWSMSVCSAKLLQSCLTLYNPMDWSPSSSSVHGILQARILQWVVMPSSMAFSQPRAWTHVFYVSWAGRQILY